MRRQSDVVICTLHWDLEEEFSNADTRKLRQHHKYYKIDTVNYKEIKHEAKVDNAHKLDSSEDSSGTTEANNRREKEDREKEDYSDRLCTENTKTTQEEEISLAYV